MFPKGALFPISTAGCRTRRQLSGDRHNQPILPSEVPVGRQPLRVPRSVPRTRNRALDHLSSLVNLTSSAPCTRHDAGADQWGSDGRQVRDDRCDCGGLTCPSERQRVVADDGS